MKFLASFCFALGLVASGSAQAFDLVSQAEYLASEAQEKLSPPLSPRSPPGSSDPIIDIRSPSLTSPVKAPVSIDLRCLTLGASKINWESLKIFYGAWKIDITDRVRKEARILSDGLQIAAADLPTQW
jgi:hypothetical protein